MGEVVVVRDVHIAHQGANHQPPHERRESKRRQVAKPLSRRETPNSRGEEHRGETAGRGRSRSEKAHGQHDRDLSGAHLAFADLDAQPLTKESDRQQQPDQQQRAPFIGADLPYGIRDRAHEENDLGHPEEPHHELPRQQVAGEAEPESLWEDGRTHLCRSYRPTQPGP